MELLDIVTVVVCGLTIIGINMMLFGLLATLGDNEYVPRVLIKYGTLVMILVLNIIMAVFFYLAITEEPDNKHIEDNCRVMFNIY